MTCSLLFWICYYRLLLKYYSYSLFRVHLFLFKLNNVCYDLFL
uniref:Uncharacterized protein n=1 Tax=Rhizophora mucronata TaxID=61149 RepID=A0A2P2PIF5_RHIMU